MRLMIINPDWGMTREQMDYRCRVLSQYVAGDVELSMECLTDTRVQLDSVADGVFAGPEIVKMAVQAQEEGYDGIILYCFSDPALEACRQVVSIPVIGGGQAACLTLPCVGYHGAILVAQKERIPEKMWSLSRTGLSMERIVGYEAADTSGLDPETDHDRMLESLTQAGRRVLQRTGAQVLVLGCLSFLGMAGELERALQVPVIEPGAAAVSMAESLVRQRLFSSEKAYLNRKAVSCTV